jgi:hypothetical protein
MDLYWPEEEGADLQHFLTRKNLDAFDKFVDECHTRGRIRWPGNPGRQNDSEEFLQWMLNAFEYQGVFPKSHPE